MGTSVLLKNTHITTSLIPVPPSDCSTTHPVTTKGQALGIRLSASKKSIISLIARGGRSRVFCFPFLFLTKRVNSCAKTEGHRNMSSHWLQKRGGTLYSPHSTPALTEVWPVEGMDNLKCSSLSKLQSNPGFLSFFFSQNLGEVPGSLFRMSWVKKFDGFFLKLFVILMAFPHLFKRCFKEF